MTFFLFFFSKTDKAADLSRDHEHLLREVSRCVVILIVVVVVTVVVFEVIMYIGHLIFREVFSHTVNILS